MNAQTTVCRYDKYEALMTLMTHDFGAPSSTINVARGFCLFVEQVTRDELDYEKLIKLLDKGGTINRGARMLLMTHFADRLDYYTLLNCGFLTTSDQTEFTQAWELLKKAPVCARDYEYLRNRAEIHTTHNRSNMSDERSTIRNAARFLLMQHFPDKVSASMMLYFMSYRWNKSDDITRLGLEFLDKMPKHTFSYHGLLGLLESCNHTDNRNCHFKDVDHYDSGIHYEDVLKRLLMKHFAKCLDHETLIGAGFLSNQHDTSLWETAWNIFIKIPGQEHRAREDFGFPNFHNKTFPNEVLGFFRKQEQVSDPAV